MDSLTDIFLENYALTDDLQFEIGFSKELLYENFLTKIYLHAEEKGKTFYLSQLGSGVQSIAIIGLHLTLAQMRRAKLVVGIEEPEINLHPQAQRQFIHFLKKVSKKYGQFLFTSHSTTMIDELDHQNIVLVTKHVDKSRGFYSNIGRLSQKFFTQNQLTASKYYKFHNFHNSDFFFSKKVILTESTNDAKVVQFLAEREGINLSEKGISVVNLDGVANLKYFFYLLKELKIPYLIILDKDFFLEYLNGKLNLSRKIMVTQGTKTVTTPNITI